jgi:iron-sulfur cluster repair protein YtfE (RIC family)
LGRLLKAAMASAEASDAKELLDSVDLFWARLAMHIRAEHHHLFPAIQQAAVIAEGKLNEVPRILSELRRDHDFFMKSLAGAVKDLRGTDGSVVTNFQHIRAVLAEIEVRLEQHNDIEEEQIYKLVGLLNEGEMIRLGAEIRNEIANYPPRFQAQDPVNE